MAWVGDCAGNALGGGGMAPGTHLTWATGKSSNLVSTWVDDPGMLCYGWGGGGQCCERGRWLGAHA